MTDIVKLVILIGLSGLFLTGHCFANPALRLSVSIQRSEYCNTSGAAVARIVLEFTIQNEGTGNAIISRLIDITRFDVGITPDDLRKQNYVESRNVQPMPMLGKSLWAQERPSEEFFYLLPADSTIVAGKRQLMIPLTLPEWQGGKQVLFPGRYYLRVEMDPWRESTQTGRRLAALWSRWGQLQLERLLSDPVTFEIERSGKAPLCKTPPFILPPPADDQRH